MGRDQAQEIPFAAEDALYSWLYARGYGEGPVRKLMKFVRRDLFGCRRILDAGCGRQALARRMTQAGYEGEIVGVDVSSHIVNEEVRHCHVVHASLDDLPMEDDAFDGIFCCDVLEHIRTEALGAVLGELRRVLAPSGLWAFSISTKKSKGSGPDGENLHLTVKPGKWWLETLAAEGFSEPEKCRPEGFWSPTTRVWGHRRGITTR